MIYYLNPFYNPDKKKQFICWYDYQEMDSSFTDIDKLRPRVISADDKAEALWIWRRVFDTNWVKSINLDLETYRKQKDIGGRGLHCYEIANNSTKTPAQG